MCGHVVKLQKERRSMVEQITAEEREFIKKMAWLAVSNCCGTARETKMYQVLESAASFKDPQLMFQALKQQPFMDTVFDVPLPKFIPSVLDNFYEPKYSFFSLEGPDGEETNDDTPTGLSSVISVQGHEFSVPKGTGNIRLDFYHDVFDLMPQGIDYLPQADTYAILSRARFTGSRRHLDIRKLKKRSTTPFAIQALVHPHDPDYVPDNKLMPEYLAKRMELRRKTSVKQDIPRSFRKLMLRSEKSQKHLVRVSQLASKEVRKKSILIVRSLRDVPARCKRVVREMQTYWSRYDRESDDSKRKPTRMDAETRRTALSSLLSSPEDGFQVTKGSSSTSIPSSRSQDQLPWNDIAQMLYIKK
eukprot:759256_1